MSRQAPESPVGPVACLPLSGFAANSLHPWAGGRPQKPSTAQGVRPSLGPPLLAFFCSVLLPPLLTGFSRECTLHKIRCPEIPDLGLLLEGPPRTARDCLLEPPL